MISQSSIPASPLPFFGVITRRTGEMRRSALVNVPLFSKNEAPGKNTCAYIAVSFKNKSCTITHSIDSKACVTCCVSGSDCAISSPTQYNALKPPSVAKLNILGMRRPGSALNGRPQAASNSARAESSDT